jgi:hypothetical protein
MRPPKPRENYGQELATVTRVYRAIVASSRGSKEWRKRVLSNLSAVIQDLTRDLENGIK